MNYSNIDNEAVLKYEIIGGYGLLWNKLNKNSFGIEIVDEQDEIVKTWVFENHPMAESMAFYWYSYIQDCLKRPLSTGFQKPIPDNILAFSSNEVINGLENTMIHEILNPN